MTQDKLPIPSKDVPRMKRFIRVKDFPTSGGRLCVNGDIGEVIREYVEPASEWSGKPEIPMVVAVNHAWPMPLHFQPHQYEDALEPKDVLRDEPSAPPSKLASRIEIVYPTRQQIHDEAIALIRGLRPEGCFGDEEGIFSRLEMYVNLLASPSLQTKDAASKLSPVPPSPEAVKDYGEDIRPFLPAQRLVLPIDNSPIYPQGPERAQFERWWLSLCEEAEQGPTPEEETFAWAAWQYRAAIARGEA